MNWISVADRMPENEDGDYQLVAYLTPRFGLFVTEMTLAYFDSPKAYESPEMANGWTDWHTEKKIVVTHWMRLPAVPWSEFDGMSQLEFKQKFGSFRPSLGCV